MPSPKSGSAGSLVAPASPTEPEEADVADPGKVQEVKADQRQTQAGKYGSVQVKPHQPPKTAEEKANKKSWIEIEMVDESNQPVPGQPYRVLLPDGQTAATGTLDEKGFARIEGIEPGDCQVSFPTLDQDAWEKA